MNFILSFILIASSGSFASGVIILDGTFYGKTSTDFLVLKNKQIFTLQKSKLSDEQNKYLNSLHWQQKLKVSVATTAIKDVHDKK